MSATAIDREFNSPALGFLELSSISRGLYLTDLVLKKAPVRVIASQPISSGKHVLLYVGEVAAVDESHRAALLESGETLLKQILIAGIHPKLTPFLDSLWSDDPRRVLAGLEDSVAIVESSTLAGAVIAADDALKSAEVSLLRLRLGQGIGGKAYFVLRGLQSELEAAVQSATNRLKDLNSFGRSDLIARPDPQALAYF